MICVNMQLSVIGIVKNNSIKIGEWYLLVDIFIFTSCCNNLMRVPFHGA